MKVEDPTAPDLGGRYRITRRLGRGGMASVWLAWAPGLNAWRAIKTLDATGSASARSRFENEARAMARLRHPHVIAVHDVGVDQHDRPWLVMEYAPRGSLADLLEHRGPVQPRLACRLVGEVLEGLEHAHAHGIVHRDIKPQNVLLDRDGHALVADFGIARIDTLDQTRTGAAMGTLAWMAPEQRASAQSVDARADVYAAGGLLYALLVGREPLDLFVPDADFRGVPEPLVAVIRGAVAWDRERRWPSARAFADRLAAAAAELPPDPESHGLPDAPPVEPPPPDGGAATFDDGWTDTATPAATTERTEDRPRSTFDAPPAAAPAVRREGGGGLRLALVAGAVVVAAGALVLTWGTRRSGPGPVELRQLEVGEIELDGVDFSEDGTALYFVVHDQLQRASIDGERAALGPWPTDATFEIAPGDTVLRTNWWSSVPLVRWSAGAESTLPLTGRQVHLSPAADAVAFVRDNELRVAPWPLDGTDRLVATLPDVAVLYDVGWSSDGRFLVTGDRNGESAIRRWSVDGGPPVTVVQDDRLRSPISTMMALWRGSELWYARGLSGSSVGLFAVEVDPAGRTGRERELHRWDDGTWPILGAVSRQGDVAFETARRVRAAWVDGRRLETPDLQSVRFLADGRIVVGGADGVVVGPPDGPFTRWSSTFTTLVHPLADAVLAEGDAPPDQPRPLWRLTAEGATALPPLGPRERLDCARDTVDRCVVASPAAALFQLTWLDPRTGARGELLGRTGAAREENARMAVAPGGDRVALFELTGDLVLVGLDGTSRRLPSGLRWIQAGAFAPDGSAVFAVGNTGDGWAVTWIPLDGSPPTFELAPVDALGPPDVGPGGERLRVVATYEVGLWVARRW